MNLCDTVPVDAGLTNNVKISNEVCPFLPEGTIVEVRCFSDTDNTKVSGNLNLVIIDSHS